MRCQNCGHNNPNENRFCGMCGTSLDAQPVAEAVPLQWEPVVPERETPAGTPERVERRREPLKAEPLAPPPPPQPERRSDKWWVDERETTVGGPSFLGLSSADSSNGGYSYLFQDEPERSHKGLWVFLLLLLVLGGVVYARWQPIRDYVLTTAIAHSRPKPAAAPPVTNSETAPPAQNAPTTTLASSDAQAQASTSENKPAANTDNKPPANAKEGLPQADKDAAAPAGKNEAAGAAGTNPPGTESKATNGSKPPDAKARPSAKDVASSNEANEDVADAAAEEKPSAAAAKKTRAPQAQANDGGELVSSGEKYLYGRGVARSCDQAVSYFNAAAAKQNPQAFSHLGALYATGECVPMDRALAYAWFRRAYAKEPNNHYFEQNLTMLWREMTPNERQRAAGARQ